MVQNRAFLTKFLKHQGMHRVCHSFCQKYFPAIFGSHLEFLRKSTKAHLSWKWCNILHFNKVWAPPPPPPPGVLSHSFRKTFSCHFLQLEIFDKWKSIKQSQIVISAKSLMFSGTLCFCCANTISFSLAKKCFSLELGV